MKFHEESYFRQRFFTFFPTKLTRPKMAHGEIAKNLVGSVWNQSFPYSFRVERKE
jgi:hypothetical protein